MTGRHGDGSPIPVVTLAVLIIGGVTLFAVVAATVLLLLGHQAPGGYMALASGGLGSLSTFLARTRD